MLTRINSKDIDFSDSVVKLKDAEFPTPFPGGLEYSSVARGTWNIVHTGMLLPEAHEIFVCAAGCLRGVVLTAAEMGATHRFSTIEIKEHNLFDGSMETLVIEGVRDILGRMDRLPPAVLIYTSCIHHFTGCDLDMIYGEIRKSFPTVDFADCYMTPIMRKSGLTPDLLMRRQLYSLLRPRRIREKTAAIIGNDIATDKGSELMELLGSAGYSCREIHDCNSYEEYQELAESSLYITYYPPARVAGEALSQRLGGSRLHLPMKFSYEEIEHELAILASAIAEAGHTESTSDEAERKYSGETLRSIQAYSLPKIKECERALENTRILVGEKPIAIDYTAFPCPLSLAWLLLTHGFKVKKIFADSFNEEEKNDFIRLKENYPELELCATVSPKMRFYAPPVNNEYLAIGQKAAHLTGTKHFVNIVQGGGLWGYTAIIRLCELMQEAYLNEKDMRKLIQIKGLGCECCL